MPIRIAPWLLAAALGSMTAVARADMELSSTLTGFGWSLTDLRPDDGIAPALSFVPVPSDLWSRASAYATATQLIHPPGGGSPYSVDSFNRKDAPGTVHFPSLQAGAAVPHAEASAQMGGDVAAHDFSMAVHSRLRVSPDDTALESVTATSYLSALPALETHDLPNLMLTPYTRVVWSGEVSMAGSRTPSPWSEAHESGVAIFNASLLDPANGLRIGVVRETLPLRAGNPAAQRRDFHMRLEWSNDSADAAGALFFLQFQHIAEYLAVSPPVPEPGTWALMACGLGVVGAAAARRRARTAA